MTPPMLCRNCQKNAESRQTAVGSLVEKAIGATHGLHGIFAQNANHQRKKILRQRGDNSSSSKVADRTGSGASLTPRGRSSMKRKRSEKQNVPTVGPLKINLGNNDEDMDLGAASRTRSKKMMITEADEVGFIRPGSSSSDEDKRKINKTSSNDYGNNRENRMADESLQPRKRNQYSSGGHDVFAVLERGQILETHEQAQPDPELQSHHNLPLKFRFEDELPKPAEKTEYEKEMDGLFADLDLNWSISEAASFDHPKVDQENEAAPPEETQYSRCCRGEHELVLQDDVGLECIYCHEVVLEARYVLPPWAEKVLRKSKGRRPEERL